MAHDSGERRCSVGDGEMEREAAVVNGCERWKRGGQLRLSEFWTLDGRGWSETGDGGARSEMVIAAEIRDVLAGQWYSLGLKRFVGRMRSEIRSESYDVVRAARDVLSKRNCKASCVVACCVLNLLPKSKFFVWLDLQT